MDHLERIVQEIVLRVVREKSPETTCVENGQGLTAGLGLDSLDIARLIAVLELKLGVDPFASLVAITDVRTVGDLCAAYRSARGSPAEANTVPSFAASVQRAKARRSARPPEEPPK
jgi:acyl carrier protein